MVQTSNCNDKCLIRNRIFFSLCQLDYKGFYNNKASLAHLCLCKWEHATRSANKRGFMHQQWPITHMQVIRFTSKLSTGQLSSENPKKAHGILQLGGTWERHNKCLIIFDDNKRTLQNIYYHKVTTKHFFTQMYTHSH